MKVLFMNGPAQDRGDRFYSWPTPLLYAIAPTVEAIRSGELDVEVAGPIFDPWTWDEERAEAILSAFEQRMHDVDVVCASATYDALHPTLECFRRAKQANPRVTAILGGPHVDEVHGDSRYDLFRLAPGVVDYVVAGDGEVVLRELLRELRKPHPSLSEIAARSSGNAWIYHSGGERAAVHTILDLNALPFMPLDLAPTAHRADFDVFRTSDGHVVDTAQVLAARGCPFRCTFCSERSDLAPLQRRSVERVMEEVLLRKEQGFGAVFFDDSTFGSYRPMPRLLEALGHTGLQFGCQHRFDYLQSPRTIETYRCAGFTYFFTAIEQFDDAALKAVNKSQTVRQIRQALQALEQAGMKVGAALLFGLPQESREGVLATLDFTAEWIDRGVIELASMSALSLHPGTPEGARHHGVYHGPPPHTGYPWDRFQEGRWYHPSHVTADYLAWIDQEATRRIGASLMRSRAPRNIL